MKDYYKILGVSRDESLENIKKAYRRLARKYHPDVNPGDKKSEEKFKEINEAYNAIISGNASEPHKEEAKSLKKLKLQHKQKMILTLMMWRKPLKGFLVLILNPIK